MRLRWERCPPSGGEAGAAPEPRPLVVCLTWVGARAKHVNTYVQMIHRSGWDVLVASPPSLALWAPYWAAANARKVLSAVAADLEARGERPVVFFAFSGAVKVRVVCM